MIPILIYIAIFIGAFFVVKLVTAGTDRHDFTSLKTVTIRRRKRRCLGSQGVNYLDRRHHCALGGVHRVGLVAVLLTRAGTLHR